MKRLMLIGGILGFALGLGCGISMEGAQWPGVLFRATLACLGGSLLLRWWGRAWIKNLREVQAQQRAALARAEQLKGPKTPWKMTAHANHH